MAISYQPIGFIRSPFSSIENVPIQPPAAEGVRGTVTVFAEFAAGLKDLEGFSYILLLYHFHLVAGSRLTVVPFLDSAPRGVFSTRAPARPNPIGLSIVRLLVVEGNVLQVENVDIVDGTPLLDIKPYVPAFDHWATERIGWLATAREDVRGKKSDDRFK
jgi:tRNA-Thr(GGU) m(6)t(6)A37 methyltransferase TsaA